MLYGLKVTEVKKYRIKTGSTNYKYTNLSIS